MNKKVHSITITYNPEIEILKKQWAELSLQLDKIWVIDNGTKPVIKHVIYSELEKFPKVHFIELEKNYGIGYALNRGIEFCLQMECDYVLLLDHDSIPFPDMVNQLVFGFLDIKNSGLNPACIGPRIWDRKMDIPMDFVGEKKTSMDGVLNVTHLFTSGTLIPVDSIQTVGNMREDFFIDQVDVEWCIRARYFGLEIYGTDYAKLSHSIGENLLEIKWLKKKLITYTPLRNYYMIRNMILLLKSIYPDKKWKRLNLRLLIQRSIYWLLFLDQKWLRIRYICKGYLDGRKGITGSIDSYSK